MKYPSIGSGPLPEPFVTSELIPAGPDEMLETPTRLLRRIFDTVDERAKQLGLDVAGWMKAVIPASYVSGPPKIQQAFETASTLGSKTHKILQPAGNRNAAVVAGDPIAVPTDKGGNRVVAGKLVDVGQSVTDAEYLMGLRPMAPGNTLLLTANNEESTTSASYVDVKRFWIGFPGAVRIKGQLSRDGGTARARVVIEMPDGTKLIASPETTYAGTVYPTFGSQFSLDMTQRIGLSGAFVIVQLLNDSGGQVAYINNVTVNYADATAVITPYTAVITD